MQPSSGPQLSRQPDSRLGAGPSTSAPASSVDRPARFRAARPPNPRCAPSLPLHACARRSRQIPRHLDRVGRDRRDRSSGRAFRPHRGPLSARRRRRRDAGRARRAQPSDDGVGTARRHVEAGWRFDGRTAVIEMAQASGLELVGGPDGNDPIVGVHLRHRRTHQRPHSSRGRSESIVGVGGSRRPMAASGALRALLSSRLRGVSRSSLACDVRTRFVDAAAQFAPQKGASPAQVEMLRRRLERLADVYRYGVRHRRPRLEGGGAAGGLAGGLAAVGARPRLGVRARRRRGPDSTRRSRAPTW